MNPYIIIMNPKSSMNDESWIFMNNKLMNRSCVSLHGPCGSPWPWSNPRFTGTWRFPSLHIGLYEFSTNLPKLVSASHLFLTVKYELGRTCPGNSLVDVVNDRFPLANEYSKRSHFYHSPIGRRSLPESPRLFQGIPILNLSTTHKWFTHLVQMFLLLPFPKIITITSTPAGGFLQCAW